MFRVWRWQSGLSSPAVGAATNQTAQAGLGGPLRQAMPAAVVVPPAAGAAAVAAASTRPTAVAHTAWTRTMIQTTAAYAAMSAPAPSAAKVGSAPVCSAEPSATRDASTSRPIPRTAVLATTRALTARPAWMVNASDPWPPRAWAFQPASGARFFSRRGFGSPRAGAKSVPVIVSTAMA